MDEWHRHAVFQELSCHPASMEAAKCTDAYSCFPGHDGEQDDAEQAFIQADIDDSEIETFARIPREYLPKKFQHMTDPVVRVKKALYGHPDAPGLWEKNLEQGLRDVEFLPIHENWPSVFFHERLKLLLMVYVDDFKLAGPSKSLAEG